jgi:hypothetical protein
VADVDRAGLKDVERELVGEDGYRLA